MQLVSEYRNNTPPRERDIIAGAKIYARHNVSGHCQMPPARLSVVNAAVAGAGGGAPAPTRTRGRHTGCWSRKAARLMPRTGINHAGAALDVID